MLHCNPIMEGIVDPSTVTVEIKWWLSEEKEDNTTLRNQEEIKSKKRLVFKENFRLPTKTFSTLNRQYWKIGDTVYTIIHFLCTSMHDSF